MQAEKKMEEKKWVKVTSTRTDSTGSGYYRAEDGRYLYGNPKNGYMRLTLEEQEKQRQQAEAQASAQSERQRNLAELDAIRAGAAQAGSGGSDHLESLLVAGGLGALFGVFLYCSVVIGLFFSVTTMWPDYIKSTVWGLSHIFGGLTLIDFLRFALQAAHIGGLVLLFVKALRKDASAQPPDAAASSYAKPAFAVTFVIYLVLGAIKTRGSGLVTMLFSSLFNTLLGALYIILPTLILYYRAYRAGGGRGFVKYLAQDVCERLPGGNKIPLIMGVLTILLSLVLLLSVAWGVGGSDLMNGVTCLLMGVFGVVFGILGR